MLRNAFSRLCLTSLGLVLLTATGCNDAGSSADSSGNRNGSLPLLSVGEGPSQPETDFASRGPTLAEPTEAVPTPAEPNTALDPELPNLSLAEVELARAVQLWAACQQADIEAETRIENLLQIVDRTSRAVELTRGNREQSDVFNLAAVTRANARMQLALADFATHADDAGESSEFSHADLLSREADDLFRSSPTSMAATETAYRVVELAREMASSHAGGEDAQWTVAYARQSRLFARRFPQESHRVPLSLITAGQMSERAGLMDEARQCYAVITDNFADCLSAPLAQRSLARINLIGEPIAGFAGETLSGGWLDVAEAKGRAVVIVFWSSDSPEFHEQFEQIQIWKEMHGDNLQIVGVNLDTDESAVRDFVETHEFFDAVMFPSNPEMRGENHPLAMQFAVNESPSYWLISAEGIVMGAPIGFDDLNDSMTQAAE